MFHPDPESNDYSLTNDGANSHNHTDCYVQPHADADFVSDSIGDTDRYGADRFSSGMGGFEL